MTPTNTSERLARLAASAKGFIYTVARKGVTGSETNMNQEIVDFIERCRDVSDLPLAVGFGVSRKSDIDFIGEHADIAVIGTAALKAWEQGKADSLRAFFNSLFGK
jgi:tryptophan synthase alpha chain